VSTLAGFTDRYVEAETPLHRADAAVKLPAVLAYVLALALTREGAWGVLAASALPIVLAAALGGCVPLAFTRPGEVVFVLPVTGWDASREGIEAVATILARSWLSVLAVVLLTASTPVAELLHALRTLRVPRLLVATVFFTYRYFHVVGDEAMRMMRARDSRSAALPGRGAGGTITWRASVLGHMVGSLFLRSLDRSERVHAAMQARGFTGDLRFLATSRVRGIDVAAAAALVAYAFAVQAAGRLA
jgi:cobalt/nickel transport system permease protein